MPDQNEEQQAPQPSAQSAINALGAEIEELWRENRKLRDRNVYQTAMLADQQEMIGSLLEQISKATPAPTDDIPENKEG